MIDNRRFRDHQYEMQQEKDRSDATTRDIGLYQQKKEDYEREIQLQQSAYERLIEYGGSKKHKDSVSFCEMIVNQIAALSMHVSFSSKYSYAGDGIQSNVRVNSRFSDSLTTMDSYVYAY
jgi:hypothetical protein